MKPIVRRLICWPLALIMLTMLVCFALGNWQPRTNRERTRAHAEEALAYCRANNLSTEYCFLVDFSIPSGRNRFFIWDFRREKVVYSGVCTHGRGNRKKGYHSTLSTPQFSTAKGSWCSTLCHARVGIRRDMSSHPMLDCFELEGLDSANRNLHDRTILIHPWIGQWATYPFPLPAMTQGCFGLSFWGFNRVAHYKRLASRPVLLWSYR